MRRFIKILTPGHTLASGLHDLASISTASNASTDILICPYLETMWLLCDRGVTPSDRGQWGSALPAPPFLSMGEKPGGRPENNLCTPMPAISRPHPSVARGCLIVDSSVRELAHGTSVCHLACYLFSREYDG
jgi:hypothetical protein